MDSNVSNPVPGDAGDRGEGGNRANTVSSLPALLSWRRRQTDTLAYTGRDPIGADGAMKQHS